MLKVELVRSNNGWQNGLVYGGEVLAVRPFSLLPSAQSHAATTYEHDQVRTQEGNQDGCRYPYQDGSQDTVLSEYE